MVQMCEFNFFHTFCHKYWHQRRRSWDSWVMRCEVWGFWSPIQYRHMYKMYTQLHTSGSGVVRLCHTVWQRQSSGILPSGAELSVLSQSFLHIYHPPLSPTPKKKKKSSSLSSLVLQGSDNLLGQHTFILLVCDINFHSNDSGLKQGVVTQPICIIVVKLPRELKCECKQYIK